MKNSQERMALKGLLKKQSKIKRQSGITLIALIITIIVLLILVAVSIATLTGENGILTKATTAKEKTNKQKAYEKVQSEVLGSYGDNGEIDLDVLNKNLKNNISGLKYKGSEISDINKITKLPVKVTVNIEGEEFEIQIGVFEAKISEYTFSPSRKRLSKSKRVKITITLDEEYSQEVDGYNLYIVEANKDYNEMSDEEKENYKYELTPDSQTDKTKYYFYAPAEKGDYNIILIPYDENGIESCNKEIIAAKVTK